MKRECNLVQQDPLNASVLRLVQLVTCVDKHQKRYTVLPRVESCRTEYAVNAQHGLILHHKGLKPHPENEI